LRIKNYLLIFFLFDLFILLWGLSVAVQTFLIAPDVLTFPEENVRLLFILFILFVITSVAGLIISILYNKKNYIKLFSALQIAVFVAGIAGKSIFG